MSTVRYPTTHSGPTAFDVGFSILDLELACRTRGASGPFLYRTVDGWNAEATFSAGRRFHETLRAGPGRLDAVCASLADKVRAEP